MDTISSSQQSLQNFKERIAPNNLLPLWERRVRLTPGSDSVATQWQYQTIRPLLEQACQLISKKDADRRVLVMENPALRGSSFIANSLFAGQQIILPGELAPSHRHTPNAFRFIVEGEGAYTSIDGVKIMMRPGDFIVTPNWAWHDHGNHGDAPVVWMDGLDTPFTSLFGAHFRENYPEDTYPVTHQSMTPDEFSKSYLYPFSTVEHHLRSLNIAEINPAHAYCMRYLNPLTGQDPLMTVAAYMQMIPAGFEGTPYRSTENKVFNVAKGACRIEVSGQAFLLEEHDVLVIPSWETYRIVSSQETFIFSFSDRTAQEKLGFWREEYLTLR
jgi:gentisate 1,2-dioxygenase